MKLRKIFSIAVVFLILAGHSAHAHPGRLDRYGGHNKTADGTYHYHSGTNRTIEYRNPPGSANTPKQNPSPAPTPIPTPIPTPDIRNDLPIIEVSPKQSPPMESPTPSPFIASEAIGDIDVEIVTTKKEITEASVWDGIVWLLLLLFVVIVILLVKSSRQRG